MAAITSINAKPFCLRFLGIDIDAPVAGYRNSLRRFSVVSHNHAHGGGRRCHLSSWTEGQCDVCAQSDWNTVPGYGNGTGRSCRLTYVSESASNGTLVLYLVGVCRRGKDHLIWTALKNCLVARRLDRPSD